MNDVSDPSPVITPAVPAPALAKGYATTEFWLTIAGNVAAILLAVSEILPAEKAATLALIANAIYALSRGLAKQGPGKTLLPLFAAALLSTLSGCAGYSITGRACHTLPSGQRVCVDAAPTGAVIEIDNAAGLRK